MALDYKNSLSRYRKYLQSIQNQPLLGPGLWTVFSLLLLVGVLVFALRPTLITISGLIGQIEQRKIVSEALDRKIYSIQKATDEFTTIEPRLNLLDEALPENPNWELLTRKLEVIATESGIRLEKIQFKNVVIASSAALTKPSEATTNLPANTSAVEFSISGKGEYKDLKIMTDRIEKMRRILVLSSIDMSRDDKGELNIIVIGEAGFIPAKN